MKTTALAAVLSAFALGGVGLLYLKVDRLAGRLDSLSRSPVGEERTRGAAAGEENGSGWLARPRNEAVAVTHTNPGSGATAHPGQAGRRAAATVEARLARLERKVEESVPRRPAAAAPYRLFGGRQRVYARSMDDLAKSLHLTATQRDRVKTAVDRGRERIESILKIPDESGKSPFERRQEQRKKLAKAAREGKMGTIFSFGTNMLAERSKKIPGRNETYGQEIDRIKKETREEIGGALSTDQEKSFEDTNIDPLIGAQGSTGAVSILFTGASGAGAQKEAPEGN